MDAQSAYIDTVSYATMTCPYDMRRKNESIHYQALWQTDHGSFRDTVSLTWATHDFHMPLSGGNVFRKPQNAFSLSLIHADSPLFPSRAE